MSFKFLRGGTVAPWLIRICPALVGAAAVPVGATAVPRGRWLPGEERVDAAVFTAVGLGKTAGLGGILECCEGQNVETTNKGRRRDEEQQEY